MLFEDFLQKINWEGGIAGAIIDYGLDPRSIKDINEEDKEELVLLSESLVEKYNQLKDLIYTIADDLNLDPEEFE